MADTTTPAPTTITKDHQGDLDESEGRMLMPPPPLAPLQDPSTVTTMMMNMMVKRDVYQKAKWTKISEQTAKHSVIPSARHGHRAIAYKNLMIVFSGGNEGLFEEVNVFNTTTNEWSQPQVKGDIPPGRASYGAVIDGHRILIFGGMEERCIFSDSLYELNIPKWEWTLLTPYSRTNDERPCARIGHSFTLMKDRVFMFGGLANANHPDLLLSYRVPMVPRYLNDLHILYVRQNMQHGAWEVPVWYGNPPCPRESHSAVGYASKDGRYNKLVVYGGMFGNRLGDLHTFDIDTMMWSQIKYDGRNSFPRPRSLHSASIVGDKMYIFGGWTIISSAEISSSQSFSSLWRCDNSIACLNLKSMTWEKIQTRNEDEDRIPHKRAGHSAAVINNKIYIWSGRDGFNKRNETKNVSKQVCCNDMWKLDTQKPDVASKVRLLKSMSSMLVVGWDAVSGADGYILQIIPFEMPHSTTVVLQPQSQQPTNSN